MTEHVSVVKDEDKESPIPTAWRKTFVDIVEAFKGKDFKLERKIPGVKPVLEQDAVRIAGNIEDYGAQLVSLPDETWQTSVCRWMRGYWEVLIDLFTVEEGASDLVLTARVYEDELAYRIEVQSVHVP